MKAQTVKLYADVAFLTSILPARNYKNAVSLEKACAYISQELRAAGAVPQQQTWLADGREYKNVIASYNETKTQRLIVGAHYDVCGDQPGADDNASAVAGLLETARRSYLQQSIQLKRKQAFLHTTMLNLYYLLLSAGLLLYMIEFAIKMSRTGRIAAYGLTVGWIVFNWFYIRLRQVKNNNAG